MSFWLLWAALVASSAGATFHLLAGAWFESLVLGVLAVFAYENLARS